MVSTPHPCPLRVWRGEGVYSRLVPPERGCLSRSGWLATGRVKQSGTAEHSDIAAAGAIAHSRAPTSPSNPMSLARRGSLPQRGNPMRMDEVPARQAGERFDGILPRPVLADSLQHWAITWQAFSPLAERGCEDCAADQPPQFPRGKGGSHGNGHARRISHVAAAGFHHSRAPGGKFKGQWPGSDQPSGGKIMVGRSCSAGRRTRHARRVRSPPNCIVTA